MSHGSIRIRNPPPVEVQQLRAWFQESPQGRVEGIVWHCSDGTLLKVKNLTASGIVMASHLLASL